ncbi:MAG: outer membrane beta-barrel protein [bacterium]|nr:outer membrane beta-barrel protein [bacterium]
MRQQRSLLLILILVALTPLFSPGSSSAQSTHRYSIGLMGGFGASTSSEPASPTLDTTFVRDDEFEFGLEFLFNMEMRRGTLFGVRVGQLDVELANPSLLALSIGPVESELTYLTLSGEYRLSAGHYQSGLFAGIGYYGIDGQNFFEDDSAIGLVGGTTGDFRLADRWSLMLEFTAHYADLDYAQFFIMGHVGLAYHF